MSQYRSRYSANDWVEVRSSQEILATLDDRAELDALPFMPEMLRFCGCRFQVSGSAHKTCDTVNKTRGRRLTSAVHLKDLRCDGKAHGNCDAACLLFWKDAWLKPVNGPGAPSNAAALVSDAPAVPGKLAQATRASVPGHQEPVYACQATRLYDATTALSASNLQQYWDDIRSGNESAWEAMKVLFLAVVYRMRKIPYCWRISSWIYDRLHQLIRKAPSPYIHGSIPAGDPTPVAIKNLRPGELVEIKSPEEIVATMDRHNFNRGMRFDKEMTPFCGQRFKVMSKVQRVINEQSGKMIEMRTPAVILQGVYCLSRYSEGRLLCPRQLPSFWREIWLRRVNEPDDLHRHVNSS